MTYKHLPRRRLGFLPTPLTALPRLSALLGGPRLLIKRDDQTGLGLGGNKTRKLEFLLGEALARGCDTLITGGAQQSNHCRQTAAAAAACGLRCHLVLGGEAPAEPEGNLLLDHLFGATIHWSGELRKGEKIPEIAKEIRSRGGVPFVIPYGGSNPTGAAAFVEAVAELCGQLDEQGERVTHIVFPSSSGGTQAGLLVGKMVMDRTFEIVGIAIDKGEAGEAPFETHVLDLANATAARLGVRHEFGPTDVILRSDYAGAGYGVVDDLERHAIRLLARTEGILLDPVYTGRAMGALLDMIEKEEFSSDDTILFWHTGGAPALFSYAAELLTEP